MFCVLNLIKSRFSCFTAIFGRVAVAGVKSLTFLAWPGAVSRQICFVNIRMLFDLMKAGRYDYYSAQPIKPNLNCLRAVHATANEPRTGQLGRTSEYEASAYLEGE